jgi:outer membrane immunogenic protein
MSYQIASAFIIALACAPATAGEARDWSGFYLGAHLGIGSLDTEFRSDFDLLPSDTYQSTPKSGGIHIGYGREVGGFYVGVEGDIGAYGDAEVSDWSTSTSASGGIVGGGVGGVVGSCIGSLCSAGRTTTVTASAEGFDTTLRSVASVKARLGYPAGRFLPFVSTGVAAGDIETNYLAGTTTSTVRDDGAILGEPVTVGHLVEDREFMFGYTLGGGLEYAINSRVSIRGEYVFTDLGKRIYEHPDGTGSESFKTRLHEGRIGLSLRF